MIDAVQCIAEDVCRICEDLGQIRRELVASHAKKASHDCWWGVARLFRRTR